MVILVQNMKTANKQFFLIILQLRFNCGTIFIYNYIYNYNVLEIYFRPYFKITELFLVIESKYKKSLEIQDYS